MGNTQRSRRERQAKTVVRFLEADIPDFLCSAIVDAIAEAARLTNLPAPTYEHDHESTRETERTLATLFSKTGGIFSLRTAANTRAALAAALSAVLKHPETPVDLYNAMADELTDLAVNLDTDTPGYIADVLEATHRRADHERDAIH